ncbi:MAG: hypothetical protein KC421_08635 [Anaerolineales bacterium]|nr:hypothetical protein [Anaerolineales bacterium]
MAVLTFTYDESFDPAMPVVELQLAALETGITSKTIKAMVDSGSDGSMMPIDALEEVGALSVGTAVMSGIWGNRQRVNIYYLSVRIGEHMIRGVRVAGIPTGMDALVGRNLLNQIVMTLNGPANSLEIPMDGLL